MRTRNVSVSLFVVLAVSLLGMAAIAGEGGYTGRPSFGITVQSMWGSGESWSQFAIDPPGYPDGYQNGSFYDSGEQFKSFAAYQLGANWLSYINFSALLPGETISGYGKIWSGTQNQQTHMIVNWQANKGYAGYGWSMKVFSPDWLTELASVTPDFLSDPAYGTPYPVDWDYGSFSLPILPCSNRESGYNFYVSATNPVPEPSSMAAMIMPLIGLAGYGLRRHRS